MNLNQDLNNEESSDNENINSEENKINQKSNENEEEDKYKFGWSGYSEITNGRFAMLGIVAIILIELISQKSFLEWAGIL